MLTATSTNQGTTYSADVYDSLRGSKAGQAFPDANGDYARTDQTQAVILSSAGMRLGRVVYSATDPQAPPDTPKEYVFLEVGDRLGSTSFVIDQATSELLERPTFQAYGAAESDFRTPRWSNFRETIRYTGHEDDAEVGLVYFGHRFYSSILSRWVSPDPLTIHAVGGDLNPYAFVGGSPLGFVDPTGLDECDQSSQSCEPPSEPLCADSSCGDGSGGGGGGRRRRRGDRAKGAGHRTGRRLDVIRQYTPPGLRRRRRRRGGMGVRTRYERRGRCGSRSGKGLGFSREGDEVDVRLPDVLTGERTLGGG